MTWPTDAEAQRAVEETATKHAVTDLWTWNLSDPSGAVWHSPEDARRIAKACLYLGVPVDSKVTAAMWHALVVKVAALELHEALA